MRRRKFSFSCPREFVYTWWSGWVRDTFSDNSIFRVYRAGSLRFSFSTGVRACGGSRRGTASRNRVKIEVGR